MVERRIVAPFVAGSSPVNQVCGINSMGECFPYKEEVVGSSPTFRTQDADCQGVKIGFNRQIMGSLPGIKLLANIIQKGTYSKYF